MENLGVIILRTWVVICKINSSLDTLSFCIRDILGGGIKNGQNILFIGFPFIFQTVADTPPHRGGLL